MRNNLTIATQTIKDRVSALDVGEALGLEIRRGRCRCPIHGGKDYNCVLYRGDRGYYCHVCKAGGDVIKFVQESQGMDFKAAVAWLDGTFHLGLELEKPIGPEEQRRAEIALQRRKRAREFLKWKQDMRFELHLTAGQILMQLEQMRDEHIPTKPDEPWSREFCTAVRLIPEAKLFAEECYMKCTEEKKG